jgi:hypothetical protein
VTPDQRAQAPAAPQARRVRATPPPRGRAATAARGAASGSGMAPGSRSARAAEAPRRRGAGAGRGLLALLLLAAAGPGALPARGVAAQPAAAGARPGCPGVSPAGECGPPCQAHICNALAHFYHVTHGATWRAGGGGWPSDPAPGACGAWLAAWPPPPPPPRPGATVAPPPPDGAPRYCHIAGMRCCEAGGGGAVGAPDPCPFQWAPANLSLSNNNLTGSAASPELWDALGRLMVCGLRRLVLQGNRLTGPLPAQLPAAAADWLRTFDMSENQITGTLVGAVVVVVGCVAWLSS